MYTLLIIVASASAMHLQHPSPPAVGITSVPNLTEANCEAIAKELDKDPIVRKAYCIQEATMMVVGGKLGEYLKEDTK